MAVARSFLLIIGLIFSSFFSTLFATQVTTAEEIRVAVVDMDRVLNESTVAKAKRAELEKVKNTKKKDLELKKNSLTQLEAKLKEKKVTASSKEADDFRARARDFARLAHDAEEDLKREYLKSTKTLVEKAQKIINDYASELKLTLVLERGSSQRSTVLYSTNALDITNEIITRMNAQK